MFTLLVLALLVALGVAIVGWFRPLPVKPAPPPTYTDQQVADAKAKVCAAHERVHSAIKASTARDRGTDPTAQLVFAINGQQALLAGSEYLRTTLSQQPATPNELAKTIRQLTDIFQELIVEYQNNMSDSEEAPAVHAADEATLTIERLCK
jgi:ribosomal protein S6